MIGYAGNIDLCGSRVADDCGLPLSLSRGGRIGSSVYYIMRKLKNQHPYLC